MHALTCCKMKVLRGIERKRINNDIERILTSIWTQKQNRSLQGKLCAQNITGVLVVSVTTNNTFRQPPLSATSAHETMRLRHASQVARIASSVKQKIKIKAMLT